MSTLKRHMANVYRVFLVHTRQAGTRVGASNGGLEGEEKERAMLVSIGQQRQQVAAARAAGKSWTAIQTKRFFSNITLFLSIKIVQTCIMSIVKT